MTLKIRRLIQSDLKDVSNLYNGRKSIDELNWLFTNPDNPDEFNAYVAVEGENEIIGAVGYMILNFQHLTKTVKGVIPMSWITESNHRGLAGILLLKKVLEVGDFGYGIRGSQMAQEIFYKFNFIKVAERYSYQKTFIQVKSFVKQQNISLKKIIRIIQVLPKYILNIRNNKIYRDVEFLPYQGELYIGESNADSVFKLKISKSDVDWLSSCPLLESYVFNIKQKEVHHGFCIFYIKKIRNITHGRIVYISYLGNDKKLWDTVISLSLTFFKTKKCNIVDTIGLNANHISCLKRYGFIRSQKSQPIFARDPDKKLKNIDFTNMYTQYPEGDKAYRGF